VGALWRWVGPRCRDVSLVDIGEVIALELVDYRVGTHDGIHEN